MLSHLFPIVDHILGWFIDYLIVFFSPAEVILYGMGWKDDHVCVCVCVNGNNGERCGHDLFQDIALAFVKKYWFKQEDAWCLALPCVRFKLHTFFSTIQSHYHMSKLIQYNIILLVVLLSLVVKLWNCFL
jgi:hypothetical protein